MFDFVFEFGTFWVRFGSHFAPIVEPQILNFGNRFLLFFGTSPQKGAKRLPRGPLEPQEAPRGTPRGIQEIPWRPKETPRGPREIPKRPQETPKVPQEEPQGKRDERRAQREERGANQNPPPPPFRGFTPGAPNNR